MLCWFFGGEGTELSHSMRFTAALSTEAFSLVEAVLASVGVGSDADSFGLTSSKLLELRRSSIGFLVELTSGEMWGLRRGDKLGEAPEAQRAAAASVEMSALTLVSNESGVESVAIGSFGFVKLDWIADEVAGFVSNTKCPDVGVLEVRFVEF